MPITPQNMTVWSSGEVNCVLRVSINDAGLHTYSVGVELCDRPHPPPSAQPAPPLVAATERTTHR
jgi:hypothetical protein